LAAVIDWPGFYWRQLVGRYEITVGIEALNL